MGYFGDVLPSQIPWLSTVKQKEETKPSTTKANNTTTKW